MILIIWNNDWIRCVLFIIDVQRYRLKWLECSDDSNWSCLTVSIEKVKKIEQSKWDGESEKNENSRVNESVLRLSRSCWIVFRARYWRKFDKIKSECNQDSEKKNMVKKKLIWSFFCWVTQKESSLRWLKV